MADRIEGLPPRDRTHSPQGLSPQIKLIIEALARDVAARENREAAVDDESKAA